MSTKTNTGGSQFVGADGLTHYQRNRLVYLAQNKLRRSRNKKYIENIKESGICTDCKKQIPLLRHGLRSLTK